MHKPAIDRNRKIIVDIRLNLLVILDQDRQINYAWLRKRILVASFQVNQFGAIPEDTVSILQEI